MSTDNQQIFCQHCNTTHNFETFEIWFRYPDAALKIPFDQHRTRINYLKDYCIIDNITYLVRGWIQIPVLGWPRPHFWGCWAQVDEPTYRRCFELRLHEDQSTEPAMHGTLATQLPGYSIVTRGLQLTIQLHSAGTLPQFVITEATPTIRDSDQQQANEEQQHGTLVHQQNFGVQPNDMIRWFHACM